MSYDTARAQQLRQILSEQPAVTEKTMFGGLVFMVHGHIACGMIGDEVLVRVGAERYRTAIQEPHVRPFQLGRRQSTGWVLVGAPALAAPGALAQWVGDGLAFVATLPPKQP